MTCRGISIIGVAGGGSSSTTTVPADWRGPGVGALHTESERLAESAGFAPPFDAVLAANEPPRLHVLIVDDNAINRMVLELFVENLGATSHSVENGAQAVEAAALLVYDAILMDICMPVMDGLTATRIIRLNEQMCNQPPTPIIVVSANGEPEDIAAALAAGAQQHVAKPITMNVIYRALSVACDAEQQRPAM